jgi:phosphoglycerate dehydrogenase-like enzyme
VGGQPTLGRVRVLVPDDPERAELEPLPPGMELSVLGSGAPEDDVEVLVPEAKGGAARLQLIARLPRLRVVQTLSAGVDWLRGSVPEGVTVCDARGVHDVPVSEWATGAILAGLKGLGTPMPSVRELCGLRVLILGAGSIGAALEQRLAGFAPEVVRVARHARAGVHGVDELPRLLPDADVLVLLLPLTDDTRDIVDRDALALLPDDALVVNAGRGPLVETDALVAELESGRLRAVLDVTEPEPLPDDHPLRRAPHVLLTPHLAGASPRFATRAYRLVRAQLERLATGQPLANVVGPDGY